MCFCAKAMMKIKCTTPRTKEKPPGQLALKSEAGGTRAEPGPSAADGARASEGGGVLPRAGPCVVVL